MRTFRVFYEICEGGMMFEQYQDYQAEDDSEIDPFMRTIQKKFNPLTLWYEEIAK